MGIRGRSLWLGHVQGGKDHGLEMGGIHQLLDGFRLGVFAGQALQQCLAFHLHTADLQLCQGMHQLCQTGMGPIQVHRHMVALAQDVPDPVGA